MKSTRYPEGYTPPTKAELVQIQLDRAPSATARKAQLYAHREGVMERFGEGWKINDPNDKTVYIDAQGGHRCTEKGVQGRCWHWYAARLKEVGDDDEFYAEFRTETPPVDVSKQNEAYALEDEIVPQLARQLCATIPWDPPAGRGRPPVPLPDRCWQVLMQVESERGCRRGARRFKSRDYLTGGKVRSDVNALSRFLNKKETTLLLQELLLLSSMPAASVETGIGVDGTGMDACRSSYYESESSKRGQKLRKPRIHVTMASGHQTNLITAAGISFPREDARSESKAAPGETTYFVPLIEQTMRAKFRALAKITGDAAYGNQYNYQVGDRHGVTCFLEPKKNIKNVGRRDSAYSRGALMALGQPARFRAERGPHQNVEATNHSLKQVIGSEVRSKSQRAIKNEILCKLILHNLRLLVHRFVVEGQEVDFASEAALLQSPMVNVVDLEVPASVYDSYELSAGMKEHWIRS